MVVMMWSSSLSPCIVLNVLSFPECWHDRIGFVERRRLVNGVYYV